jgi:arsenite-transporting ATPase
MRLLELLDSESRRLILFGGKGGVGKTSLAAAAAVYTADKGKKTLIISSDPAHSLGDVFEQDQIRSGKVEKVTGVENLFALEISPKEVLHDYQHYIDEYPALKLILGDSFETLPGSNEGFGLLDIIRMYRYENYDRVIVDTAPTGHTLRLLSFPWSGSFGFAKPLVPWLVSSPASSEKKMRLLRKIRWSCWNG